MYIRKLDVAFRRQGRNFALLLDNASVHKTKLQLTNIKLVFLPANTTSKLQALDLETNEDSTLPMKLPGFTTDDDSLKSTVGDEESDKQDPVNIGKQEKIPKSL